MELENEVQELLQYLKDTIRSGEAFVLEQAPLVAQEILTWGILVSSVGLVLGIGVLVLAFTLHLIGLEEKEGSRLREDLYEVNGGGWMLIVSIISILGFITSIIHFMQLMKVLFAPRLYLIDAITKMIS